jgi:hypothetical protein
MLMTRYLPRPGRSALRANGREYRVTGAVVDLPAVEVIGGDQGTLMLHVCATADRPSNVPGAANFMPPLTIPTRLYDSDLAAMVFAVPDSFPLRWVDISGAPV